MLSNLPRFLFRTLRSVRFCAGAAASFTPQIPWAPPEVGRRFVFYGAVMAAQRSSPLQADSQRLEVEEKEEEEAGRGGMDGKVQPPTASEPLSQQIGEKEKIINTSSGPKAKRRSVQQTRPAIQLFLPFNVGGGGEGTSILPLNGLAVADSETSLPRLKLVQCFVPTLDGKQTLECKRKERKTQRKKPCSSNNSIDNLMAEMPFAEADIELEPSTSSKSKPSVKKKRKRIAGKGSEEDSTITKKKKSQDRPNYFISVPITNPKIIEGIQSLQNTIVQKDNRLSKAMIHYGSFHVTLLVMHLSGEEETSNGVDAFLESGGLIEELLQGKPLNLSFQGTDHFKNQVGFVKLTEGDNRAMLMKIAEIVKKKFQEKGIDIDDKVLKPHLTFMKLSKSPKLQKQGVKRIDSSMFANFKSHHFGDELMNRLDLCSMMKKKQSDGYYHCESTIVVGKSLETALVKEALHRELLPLLTKVKEIKELLSRPSIRMKIYKELLEQGQLS
ncbi:A-kinase anchoring protein 7 isoform X1 [Erythrolamprus reginae]|uniref:A-kinase anchoring protein 7 isoform X1 n=1 Tax=Erythrolamprus reginae TaxID=121349 RepID=UPI00396C7D35